MLNRRKFTFEFTNMLHLYRRIPENKEKCSKYLHLVYKIRFKFEYKYYCNVMEVFEVDCTLKFCSIHLHKKDIFSDNFWMKIEKSIDLLTPIVKWITIIQSNECMVHKVYTAMYEIQNKLLVTLPECPITKAEETKIFKDFENRKANSIGPLHFAAALLDPSHQGNNISPSEQVDAMEYIFKVATDMNVVVKDVMDDLANYKAKNNLWNKSFLWASVSSTTPVVWWRGLCGTTALSKVAIRILTAPTTSAATERSFSTFSFIHSKRRNRLTTERAGKISFLSHNWKLVNEADVSSSSIEVKKQSTTATTDTLNISPIKIDTDSTDSTETTSEDEEISFNDDTEDSELNFTSSDHDSE